MYRLNPLYRNVLIMTDEVIFHAPTKQALDPRMIQQSIIIAEERFIRDALTYDLYQELLDAKNTLVTSSNKVTLAAQINASLPTGSATVTLAEGDIVNAMEFLSPDQMALWKQHLWKLTAECVMLLATPEAFVQFGSAGVVHASPPAGAMVTSGEVTPDLKSVRWFMDKKLMDRIDPLIESMHLWLCKQKAGDPSKYGSYTKHCDCNANGIAYKRKTDWITGMYDEEDNHKCHCDY